MPPPRATQGVLRYPLTAILGNEANVRVLRELFQHGGEINAPLLAQRAGLSRQHVHRLLRGLEEIKVVERVGLGGHPSYRARKTFPLHGILEELFRAEREKYQEVSRAILTATESNSFVMAVWLYGSVARGDDTAKSDVDVAVVVNAPDVERVTDDVRERLRPAEEALGIDVSVVGIDPDDVLRLSDGDPWWNNVVRDAIALDGPDPERLASRIRRDRKMDERGILAR